MQCIDIVEDMLYRISLCEHFRRILQATIVHQYKGAMENLKNEDERTHT